MQQQEVIE